jgi:PncC family amidohydrolase
MSREVLAAAELVRSTAQLTGTKFVLAESCTAGRMAASIAAFPGVSAHLCGSFVVYRNASKSHWLDVPTSFLDDPQHGPVSAVVTQILAEKCLLKTREAEVAFAITGEIGPGAGPKDGLVFCHAAERGSGRCWAARHQLERPTPQNAEDIDARLARLNEATAYALRALASFLKVEAAQ